MFAPLFFRLRVNVLFVSRDRVQRVELHQALRDRALETAAK
jgi:hypothetical protein